MDQILGSEVGNNEVEKYLSASPQTLITPEIEKITSEINGTFIEKVQKILDMGPSLVGYKEFDEKVFRKRTGVQILKDGYITGCTDAAILFITLTRASGIPTKYVETIDKEWLNNGGNNYKGHIYTQVYDESNDKWIWVDPMGQKVIDSLPEGSVIYKEGLDSWDIGIKDFDSQRHEFEKFREQWLSRNNE